MTITWEDIVAIYSSQPWWVWPAGLCVAWIGVKWLMRAIRAHLERPIVEGALPLELVTNSEKHDAWFRAKVLEALEDTRPDVHDDRVMAHFEGRRVAGARPQA